MIKYSVIIPVRTITKYLQESISYLKKLDHSNFEVIVVTDYVEDFSFVKDNRFIFLSSGSVAPGEKRNMGAGNSRGEILVFLDDDAFPKVNCLKNADKIFEDPNIYAVGGPALTPPNVGFKERMSGRILESFLASGFTTYRHIPQRERLVIDYPTVNLFVKKESFEAIGGFSNDFWPGEDTKICLDLINFHKKPFLYSPNIVVYHHRRNVFFDHLKQISRYGKHRGLFCRLFPKTSRLPQYFIPSLFLLGLLFGSLICKPFYFSVVLIYLILLFIEAVIVGIKERNIKGFIYGVVGIFLTQITYGFFFLVGLMSKSHLKLRKVEGSNYIGG